MIILILAIVAAIAAGGKIYNKSESIGKAIGFVVLAWVVGAIAALFVFEMTGMAGNYSVWGLLLGAGVLFLFY